MPEIQLPTETAGSNKKSLEYPTQDFQIILQSRIQKQMKLQRNHKSLKQS